MKVKIHLCGQAIKYDPSRRIEKRVMALDSRPQGSLYGWQKRKVADATEWLRMNVEYPLIFCLTSPGYTSMANTTDALSKFINNCSKRHGLKHYVWVREQTKAGFPHFHFIADWHPVEHWFKKDEDGVSEINKLSRYWSGLFGSDANNSIRLGSYHPRTKRRCYYVESARQCWYLCKYIGKSIGESSMDYLGEAGFPQMAYKKTVRAFGVSQELTKWSAPVEFESQYEYTFVKKPVFTTTGIQMCDVPIRMDRSWNAGDTNFADSMLKNYRWKNTGHGETYIGYLKKDAKGPEIGQVIPPIFTEFS